MRPNKAKEASQGEGNKVTLKTIARGFTRGGETSSTCKRYARQILNMEGIPEDESGGSPEVVITFLEKDASEIHPHNDGPMVIAVKCEE